MKKTILKITSALLLSLFIFNITQAAASDHFVIEVTITDGGDTTFTIPTFPGETYDYDVDWNNDQVFEDTNNTGDATHDFTTTGTYTVRITGTFPRIYFNNTGDKAKITDVSQWGTNVWTSMEKAFYGATNLEVTAVDAPNLSSVTNLSYMFANVDALDQDLGTWDVSNVTNMSYMFFDADGLMGNVGTFGSANVYTSAPTGAQATNAGDLNNDGYSDFIVNGSSGFIVYMNDGDGTFTASALYDEFPRNIRSADLADINNDGYLDYILPDFNSLVHIFYNNGDGTFASATTITGVGNNLGATVGDLNNDGYLDIVTAHWSGSSVAVILNNGDGTFADPVEYTVASLGPRKIAIADFDNDGFNDLAVTTDGAGSISVLLNNGDGTFAGYVSYNNGGWSFTSGVDVADINQDGHIDIAVSAHGSCQYMGVLLNDGDGTFSSGSNIGMNCENPNDVRLGDMNGDGYPDAVTANGNGTVSVFLNNGAGSFSGYSNYSLGASAGSDTNVDLADFDQDGGLDIVTSSGANARAIVFLNKSLSLNLWDTSSVTNMSYMFADATTFNQNLSSWNVLYNADVTNMFSGATAFNEDFDNWNILRPSSGPGGLNIEVTASCSVSDTTLKTGEETDIEVDIEATENGDDIPYTFRWTKVLSGSDEETSHSFDTEGEYIIKGQVRTDYTDKTVTCDTITVKDSSTSSSSSNNDNDNDNDDEDEETEDNDTNESTSSFSDIISKYKSFLTTLYNLGISLPANVVEMLGVKSSASTTVRDLELGMTGDDVKSLQTLLISQGHSVLAGVTGYFGEQTKQALIEYQTKNNISPAAGYFGSMTRTQMKGAGLGVWW